MNSLPFRSIPRKYFAAVLNYSSKKYTSSNLEGFVSIYRFPYIRGVGLINRLKMYQTGLSAFAMPTATALWESHIVSPEVVLATMGLSISGCMFLYSLGVFPNKLIGSVYINKETDKVRIAFLNFWGNREDIILDLNDITLHPTKFSILSENLYKKYSSISTGEILKINTKYGEVLDHVVFNKIFYD